MVGRACCGRMFSSRQFFQSVVRVLTCLRDLALRGKRSSMVRSPDNSTVFAVLVRQSTRSLHIRRRTTQETMPTMSSKDVPEVAPDKRAESELVRALESPNLTRHEITERLFAERGAWLISALRRRTHGAPQDVLNDLAQEIWARMLREPTGPVQGQLRFFYGIAKNVVYEYWKKVRRNKEMPESGVLEPDEESGEQPGSLIENTADPTPGVDDLVIDQHKGDLFLKAVSKLDPRHRAVFIARDVKELSTKETAVLLAISTDKVERRLADARIYVWNYVTAREREFL